MRVVIYILVILFCFSVISCAKRGWNESGSPEEQYDMDWFYRHNGYAMMTVFDLNNQPVMEIIGIPLNSEAMWELVHDEISDAEVQAQLRIRRQFPVFYLTIHAHRDCLISWTSFVLEQGQSRAYPTEVLPAQDKYLAAVGRLYKQYGVDRVNRTNRNLGLFGNPYTGRDIFGLDEVELAEGVSYSVIVNFDGGLRLDEPMRIICRGRKNVLLSGEIYTTREVSKNVRIYIPPGQDLPGENIYKHGYIKMDGSMKRKRIEK